MSYIGNTPGVSSQRVVLEQVVTGSPQSAFTPVSGYTLGYVDVLVNGVEIDSADFTASDGVTVTLATAAAVGDTVKIKTWLPRGLSDGYLKSEADARYPRVDTASQGLTSTQQGNARTNINAVNKAGDTTGPITINGGRLRVGQNAGDEAIFGKDAGSNAFIDAYKAGAIFAVYTTPTGSADGASTRKISVSSDAGDLTLHTGNLVLASGKGIDFSASSNAAGMTSELLDDYETGTWNPTIVSGSGTITAVNSWGQYTKVGRLVSLQFYYNITNNGTGAGSIVITNLPFANVIGANTSSGVIREIAVTGQTGSVYFSSTTGLLAVTYINAYPGGTSHYWVGNVVYYAS